MSHFDVRKLYYHVIDGEKSNHTTNSDLFTAFDWNSDTLTTVTLIDSGTLECNELHMAVCLMSTVLN